MNNTTVIFGAPGCGKTFDLITLMEDRLNNGIAPERIALVSFTKKGSEEGRNRAIEKFSLTKNQFPWFSTIHSFAFKILELTRYEVINKAHYKKFSDWIGIPFTGYYTEDLKNNNDKYLHYGSLRVNNPVKAAELYQDLETEKERFISHNFKRFKDKEGIVDFNDMLLDFLESGQVLPVQVAFIDEAQDLTTLQWQVCAQAFRYCEEVIIAGDDDQAIYGWSGADIKKFLGIARKSKKRILTKSYRLQSKLVNFSNFISANIKDRESKKIEPHSYGGEIKEYISLDEVSIKTDESYYILCRNNYYLHRAVDEMRRRGLIYKYKGKLSVDLTLIRKVIEYEKRRKVGMLAGIEQDVILQKHFRKDVKIGAPWYDILNIETKTINYYRDLFKNKVDPGACNIEINTIHGVKGGEADNVVLMLDITKQINKCLTYSDESRSDELRCLYVGVTRAKKRLHLVASESRFSYMDLIRSC